MIRRMRQGFRQYAELDRRIWLLAAVRAVNTMGLSLAMAFMAIYLVDDRGISGSMYGVVVLVSSLCQSLAQGYAGELSDRYGRRWLMSSALWVRSLFIVALGAEVLTHQSIPLIAATMVVSSTLRGCFEPVAYAMVADIAAPQRRVAAYGLQRMGTNLGWAIGPAMGGLLSQVIHYGYVFFIAAGFLWIAAFATARLRDAEPHHADGSAPTVSLGDAVREAFGRADTTLLLVCSFLMALVHVQLFSTLPIYGAAELDLSKADLGLAYTANGAVVLLLQLPAVSAIDRVGIGRALVVGSLLYVLAYLAMGLAADLPAVVGVVFVLTLGEILVAPAHQAAAAHIGDPARMGRAFGLLGMTQTLGFAIAPLCGGILFDLLHHRPMIMWGAIAASALLLAAAYKRLTRYLAVR